MLWKLKNTPSLDFKNSNKVRLNDVSRRMMNKPVHINSNIEDFFYTSVNQNFVPVVDDEDVFIGIIKRSDIINYCYENFLKNELEER